jgi:hypothetical protein
MSMMISTVKSLVKSILVTVFDVVGYHVEFIPQKDVNQVVRLDRATLQLFREDNERGQLYREALARSRMELADNFLKQCRFYSMQQMVEFVVKNGQSGDFVECGCWKGHSTYIISTILYEHRFAGEFHVFDSFEGGLSDKSEEDQPETGPETDERIIRQKEHFSSTEEEVRNTLNTFDFVRIYKGWIPDRFLEVEDREFSFVHIDVDLYEPTRDSLGFFYPRLQRGGVIVVDDYGYAAFPGAKRAVDEFLRRSACNLFYEVPIGSCIIIK